MTESRCSAEYRWRARNRSDRSAGRSRAATATCRARRSAANADRVRASPGNAAARHRRRRVCDCSAFRGSWRRRRRGPAQGRPKVMSGSTRRRFHRAGRRDRCCRRGGRAAGACCLRAKKAAADGRQREDAGGALRTPAIARTGGRTAIRRAREGRLDRGTILRVETIEQGRLRNWIGAARRWHDGGRLGIGRHDPPG